MQKTIIICDACGKTMDNPGRQVQANGPNGFHLADACSAECEPMAHKIACAVRDYALAQNAAHERFQTKMSAATVTMHEAVRRGEGRKFRLTAALKIRAKMIEKAQKEHDEEMNNATAQFQSVTGRTL